MNPNEIRNRLMAHSARVQNWFDTNNTRINERMHRITDVMDRIGRNITIFMINGIILNIVSNYFYPEFPERFPIIYGYFDGWLQFGEFCLKAALGFIYAFFTGNLGDFWHKYTNEFGELWQQFVNWLSLIGF